MAGDRLPGRRHGNARCLIFIDFVAQCPNANTQHASRARATTAMQGQGAEDKFALDLFDRAANKQSDDFVV